MKIQKHGQTSVFQAELEVWKVMEKAKKLEDKREGGQCVVPTVGKDTPAFWISAISYQQGTVVKSQDLLQGETGVLHVPEVSQIYSA